MPRTTSRARATPTPGPRRSTRAAARPASGPPAGRPSSGPAARDRPTAVPLAVAFGLLTAGEAVYLGTLLRTPAPGLDRYLVVAAVVAALAVAGCALVWLGRARAWLLLAGSAAVTLAGIAVLATLLGALGATAAMWSAVLLATGPLGCLLLATRRTVRAFTRPATRSGGGGPRRAGER